ncbi:hypothetical protein SISNIDRAFT_461144, partial [Sistotremastrum niveocremeum HHB9708]
TRRRQYLRISTLLTRASRVARAFNESTPLISFRRSNSFSQHRFLSLPSQFTLTRTRNDNCYCASTERIQRFTPQLLGSMPPSKLYDHATAILLKGNTFDTSLDDKIQNGRTQGLHRLPTYLT